MKYLSNVDLNKNELQNARVQNLATAPSSPVVGQIYFNTTDHTGYIYDGTKWRDIAQIVDLSTKQDTLVSGTNIKTINGSSVLGSGDLVIDTGGTYTAGEGISITDDGVVSNTYGYQDNNLRIWNYCVPLNITTIEQLETALVSKFQEMINNGGIEGLKNFSNLFVLDDPNDTIVDYKINYYVGTYLLHFINNITSADGEFRLQQISSRSQLGYLSSDNSKDTLDMTYMCELIVSTTYSNNNLTVTNVQFSDLTGPKNALNVLATDVNYTTPYTPLYDGSPATKKYVDDKVQELGEYTDTNFLNITQKGSAGGVASLDSNGKVPSSQLPSYVDDVVEGYYYNGQFYTDSAHTQLITPETGKIYVDLNTNKTYRWGGTTYVEISQSTIHKYVGTIKVYNETATTTFDITHNLGSEDVIVNIYDADSGEMVIMDVTIVDSNTIQVQCNRSTNGGVDNYKVVIIA